MQKTMPNPLPDPQLTEEERTTLSDAPWGAFGKANAILHAACDVIKVVHRNHGFSPAQAVRIELLRVFCELCLRCGLNPGQEIESWLLEIGLPPISQMLNHRWWEAHSPTLTAQYLLRECDEIRTDPVPTASLWYPTKERALRALAQVAMGTPEEERAYDAVIWGGHPPPKPGTDGRPSNDH